MTRISEKFEELRKRKEGALIAYVTVGDPNSKETPRLVGALIEGGADIIELGIAFSDPIADGPTIQSAVGRSLASGTRPVDAFKIARTINEQYNTPLVLMTYYNPVFKFGLSKFLQLAKESNISGLIVPDLPVEEAAEYRKECLAAGVDTIFLGTINESESLEANYSPDVRLPLPHLTVRGHRRPFHNPRLSNQPSQKLPRLSRRLDPSGGWLRNLHSRTSSAINAGRS